MVFFSSTFWFDIKSINCFFTKPILSVLRSTATGCVGRTSEPVMPLRGQFGLTAHESPLTMPSTVCSGKLLSSLSEGRHRLLMIH